MKDDDLSIATVKRPKVHLSSPLVWVRTGLLVVSVVFYALHFVHLAADFPSGTVWNDWSRYTDEGWYADAAIRHSLLGHWFLPGDFNSAVALPVWPLLEAAVFGFTGVSLIAARALTVGVFGVMLLALYRLVERCGSPLASRPALAAPLAVFLLCLSPFFFAFDRIAILEPLVAALAVFALLAATHLGRPPEPSSGYTGNRSVLWGKAFPAVALGLLLPAMILTKPTAVALLPAVACLIWAQAGYRLIPALRLALPPALLGLTVWSGYFLGFVRPRYLEDFQYLFSANDYTGFQTDPLASVAFHTVADGRWMGAVLYPLFFVAMAIVIGSRPRFFRNPLVPSLLLWTAGYFVFLGYHNNHQSRYYLPLAVPITVLLAMALSELLQPRSPDGRRFPTGLRAALVTGCVLAIAIPDAWQELDFVLHPSYTFLTAARSIARIIRSNPGHPALILSVSGSDLSLMTGLPSINTEFGTLDLDARVHQYRPGWYVAWNEFEDEDMKAIAPFYQPVRVAEFPAMEDPDRNVLLLYRLDPAVRSDVSAIATRPRPAAGRLGRPVAGGHHGKSF